MDNLIINTLAEGVVRITPRAGYRVQDTRSGQSYSEVVAPEEGVARFTAIEA